MRAAKLSKNVVIVGCAQTVWFVVIWRTAKTAMIAKTATAHKIVSTVMIVIIVTIVSTAQTLKIATTATHAKSASTVMFAKIVLAARNVGCVCAVTTKRGKS